MNSKDKIIHIVLHHFVEMVCVVGITVIVVAYMSVGESETPIILAAIGSIGVIAGWDIHKKSQEK